MDLQTVEIPRAQAREQAAEYLRAAKRTTDPDTRAEFEEVARAYRLAARDEVPMIALTPSIVAGGTMQRSVVFSKGTTSERTERYLLPRLAALRSDARFAYTLGIQETGSIEFVDRPNPSERLRSGRLEIDAGFALPGGFKAGRPMDEWNARYCWTAMVPLVPPRHWPPRATALRSYVTLWEVDDWAWTRQPAPPRDPALLRHIGGDLYAVLATWDLTELERLVLTGRRPE